MDSAGKVDTGSYFVNFSSNVANCAAVATVHVETAQVPAFAMTSRPSATQVQVSTSAVTGITGTPTDAGFELVVFC